MTYRPGYPAPRYPRVPAADPAPRDFSKREIDIYDQHEQRQHLRETARAIRQQELRIQRIESFMRRDHAGYMNSVWHDEYSRLTGSLAEAKIRSR